MIKKPYLAGKEAGKIIMKVQFNKLCKILIYENAIKADLCKEGEISSNSIAKFGKSEPAWMDISMKIGIVLVCKVEDLFEILQDYTTQQH